MHIVDVRRHGEALAGPMAEMRGWLDAHGIEPQLFKMSIGANNVVFSLGFATVSEAAAFARVFAA